MRLWLDDERPLPNNFNKVAHSVNEAIALIEHCEKNNEQIELISLDHDLGVFACDGGDGIKLLDWLVERQTLYPVEFHTANPVGMSNMLKIYERHWK